MKKKLLVLLILAMFALMLNNSVKADAASGAVSSYIEANQTCYIDIDAQEGDEKIYVRAKERKDYLYDYSLYINDKKVKMIKEVQDIVCSVIDIQSGKKGKEIVFYGFVGGNYIGDSFGIYEYKKGKLKKIGGSKYGYYDVTSGPDIMTDGNGIVTIKSVASTSIDAGIGSYTQELKLELVKGKLKKKNKKEIEVAYPIGLDINKNTKIYQKANNKSVVKKVLKHGDRVEILKLKFVKMKKTGDKYMPYKPKTVYAYIQDSKGCNGWIKIQSNSFQNIQYAG